MQKPKQLSREGQIRFDTPKHITKIEKYDDTYVSRVSWEQTSDSEKILDSTCSLKELQKYHTEFCLEETNKINEFLMKK